MHAHTHTPAYQPARDRRGVGDLILVYKRVAGLASHTSRVSELLEQVCVEQLPMLRVLEYIWAVHWPKCVLFCQISRVPCAVPCNLTQPLNMLRLYR